MTTGMSAPPMGITAITPNTSDRPMTSEEPCCVIGVDAEHHRATKNAQHNQAVDDLLTVEQDGAGTDSLRQLAIGNQ